MKYQAKKHNITAIILSVFLFVSIFTFGFFLGSQKDITNPHLAFSNQAQKFLAQAQENDFNFGLYFEVLDKIKANHFNKNKLDDKDLFYGSLEGLAAATGDPYTVFMNPEISSEFYEDLSGSFDGIGAEIGLRDEIITIIAPLANSPAQSAGLRAGDKVYAIDGESTIGLNANSAAKKIKGPKGEPVTLTILREGVEPFDVEIIRDTVQVESVKTETLATNVYYLQITNFNDDTNQLFNLAVAEILLQEPKGIILDLRNNPGGYLEKSIDIASEWIKNGLIVAEQFGENRRAEHFSHGKGRLADIPTVVLINRGSASASEIVAGALRDYHQATIIGEASFGKGSVQTLETLSDGSALKITVANWLTPAGDYINEVGITPDIEVKFSEQDFEDNLDPQLERAIEYILEAK